MKSISWNIVIAIIWEDISKAPDFIFGTELTFLFIASFRDLKLSLTSLIGITKYMTTVCKM